MTDLHKITRRELLLHAVLLLRTVNKYEPKEKQLQYYSTLSNDELIDYITHFHDPQPDMDDIWDDAWEYSEYDFYGNYCPSCTNGDYSPGNPWDAPGMSIHDFI